jgi:hypothetical protein
MKSPPGQAYVARALALCDEECGRTVYEPPGAEGETDWGPHAENKGAGFFLKGRYVQANYFKKFGSAVERISKMPVTP